MITVQSWLDDFTDSRNVGVFIFMALKEPIIRLPISDVREVLRIDMDDDSLQALEFVKEVLAKRVKESLQPH
jgi:hypothetical protein